MPNAFAQAFALGLRPDERLTVSEWSARHRWLSSKAGSETGRWRNERTPYLVEVMDALLPWSTVRKVVVMKGAQLGFTEAGNNWIGYVVDHAPGPMLAVFPKEALAEKWSVQRLQPMIADCERLRERVADRRRRDARGSVLEKEFPGGMLSVVGANSPSNFRSMPTRYVFMDEVDDYPGDVGGEGDPVSLALRGTRNFPDSKVLLGSTPTRSGQSRIDFEYQRSDRSRWQVPCPYCKALQPLTWKRVEFESQKDDDGIYTVRPGSVRYRCAACDRRIAETRKAWMLARGRWIAERPDRSDRVRGFWINALASPPGWVSWEQIAERWIAATKPHVDRPKLQTVVNHDLAECWEEPGDAPDWEVLYRRRERYPFGEPPAQVVVLTAGVDVQRDRIEVEIVGWAQGFESWSVDYVVLPGDPAGPEAWRELDEVVDRSYRTASGVALPVRMVAVDSGFETANVYRWTRRKGRDRAAAVKGYDRLATLVGHPRSTEAREKRSRRRGGFYWPVGVEVAKRELYGWLRLEAPLEPGDPHPPGFLHFPQHDREWFKQLTAERVVPHRTRAGFTRYVWSKYRDRNEALDCRIYARAAAAIAGIDRWGADRWDAEAASLEAPAAAARPRAPKRRRVSRYLQG